MINMRRMKHDESAKYRVDYIVKKTMRTLEQSISDNTRYEEDFDPFEFGGIDRASESFYIS